MLAHIHPSRLWFTYENRPIFNDTAYPSSESGAGQGPPSAQSPFARNRCYLLRRGVLHHIREHYPSFIAHTGSCARPKPSRRLRLSLIRRVFAGCRQSLLGVGPSRHYLCNPCVGAWTPTPQCSPGALTRFFPKDNGLTSDVTSSAHQTTPAMQLQQGILFRGCSHSLMFRLPRSLDPQVAPTAEALSLQGGQAVYTTHSSVGYLPRDVASLRVRHEQLTRLDFHQLDCSLAGCSDVL